MALCRIGKILAVATTLERIALIQMLSDKKKWPAAELAAKINKVAIVAFTVGQSTVKAHRRKECGCFRDR